MIDVDQKWKEYQEWVRKKKDEERFLEMLSKTDLGTLKESFVS